MFVVEDSSADKVFCKNYGIWISQSKNGFDIENCTNTEIELGNYHAKASLNYVKAFNNQISQISNDTFKWARELTYIDLRENIIQEISVGAFKEQGKLITLYLKQNKLTRIEVGTFNSLTELKDLWLQNNQLSLIESGLFDKNTKLENLFMNENRIVAIQSTVFQNLNQAQNIHLAKNLCSNENFKINSFDQNFACFKNYELLKPYLNQIQLLKLKKDSCDEEKSNCIIQKDSLNRYLNEKSNELSQCETSLSGCETKKSSIDQEKINLAAKLESKESELSQALGEKSICTKEKGSKDRALKEMLNQLTNINNILNEYQRENITMYQARENLIGDLQICESKSTQNENKSTKADISLYILVSFVTVEFVIIIIFVWNCLTKKGNVDQIEPNNVGGESQPAVESHPNEHNLIYATLDLKPPTNKTPIKTDEVIYSTVERVSRPNESAPVVPRSYKKK